jgi:hypothetical protein
MDCDHHLQTPNHVLDCQDIPAHTVRTLHPDTTYPANTRYTLQWLVAPDQSTLSVIPHCVDAAFKTRTRKLKPSAMLLHYNYGAAAIKQWGHNIAVLQEGAKSRQPPKPAPTQPGPSRTTIHDRKVAIDKRAAAKAMLGTGAGTGVGASTGTGVEMGAETGEVEESEVQATWDEDDVMLFFWGNSKAATQLHEEKVNKERQLVEDWRTMDVEVEEFKGEMDLLFWCYCQAFCS